jgi:hypothetical protein
MPKLQSPHRRAVAAQSATASHSKPQQPQPQPQCSFPSEDATTQHPVWCLIHPLSSNLALRFVACHNHGQSTGRAQSVERGHEKDRVRVCAVVGSAFVVVASLPSRPTHRISHTLVVVVILVDRGSAALPPAFQRGPLKRRSDRHRKQERRTKARKTSHLGGLAGETDEYRAAVWIDALEGVDPAVSAAVDEEDDEYDELGELEGKSNKTTKAGKPRRGKKPKAAGALPKRFLPRSLASILTEEHGRPDGVAQPFLDAAARIPAHEQLPRRKFCPVSGAPGVYTDPRTGLPYANLKALEQIRERPPPWMTLGGAAAYLEATKSIRDEEY